jgi:hypothetical protein
LPEKGTAIYAFGGEALSNSAAQAQRKERSAEHAKALEAERFADTRREWEKARGFWARGERARSPKHTLLNKKQKNIASKQILACVSIMQKNSPSYLHVRLLLTRRAEAGLCRSARPSGKFLEGNLRSSRRKKKIAQSQKLGKSKIKQILMRPSA